MKKRPYAPPSKISQMIEAARKSGLDICSFEVSPDGTIRMMEARAPSSTPDLFERLEAQL
jgi:hypothetical protein